jgi:hypothetical protein
MVLSAVAARAFLEENTQQLGSADKTRVELLDSLSDLGLAGELEREERDLFKTRVGRADKAIAANASWRCEGLAVLAWSLGQFQLPAYDEAVDPIAAQGTVGLANAAFARELLDSATLRPAADIERFATHATVVTWRLRQYRMAPLPVHFAAYLRAQKTFRETWLEGLRFVDGDLAIGDRAIGKAAPEKVAICERIALQRQIAVYWIQGDHPIYSKVDPSTLLSAC